MNILRVRTVEAIIVYEGLVLLVARNNIIVPDYIEYNFLTIAECGTRPIVGSNTN